MAYPIHETEHQITVAAPARRVFELIVDVGDWPQIFPPTVHAEYAERGDTEERIRLWATANGEAKTWTSRRYLDQDRLSVRFRQEISQPPVATMGGEWLVEPVSDTESRVRLLHDFSAVDGDPGKTAWIERAVDRNSDAELAALSAAAEQAEQRTELLLSFEDIVRVNGRAEDAYDFIHDAGRWQERLPHVTRVALEEDVSGVQTLEMDTSAPDGSVHTTRSVRICFPHDKIVYKQLRTPALMTVHTGQWSFRQDTDATLVTSAHTVVLNPEAIPTVLGQDATIADARDFVRNALGRNSTTTMEHAKAYAERVVS